MRRLSKNAIKALGIDPDSPLSKLADVQVRRLIAKCAHIGAVRYAGHAEDQLLNRGGTREDVLRALEAGGLVTGKTEPSNGGGVKVVLRHLYCGEQFNVVVALDRIEGPNFVITVYFEN